MEFNYFISVSAYSFLHIPSGKIAFNFILTKLIPINGSPQHSQMIDFHFFYYKYIIIPLKFHFNFNFVC